MTVRRASLAKGAAMILTLLLSSAAEVHAQPAGPSSVVARCSSDQLSLGTDSENGAFDGMNHGGTLLVIRNVSTQPCAIDRFVHATFQDEAHGQLGVTVDDAPGFPHPMVDGRPVPMGHGPYVAPIALAAGAEATAKMRWVSGAVYTDADCVNVAWVSLAIAGGALQSPLRTRMCGPDMGRIVVRAERLSLDPVMPS